MSIPQPRDTSSHNGGGEVGVDEVLVSWFVTSGELRGWVLEYTTDTTVVPLIEMWPSWIELVEISEKEGQGSMGIWLLSPRSSEDDGVAKESSGVKDIPVGLVWFKFESAPDVGGPWSGEKEEMLLDFGQHLKELSTISLCIMLLI